MKTLVFATCAWLSAAALSGQSFADALRYSYVTPQGTARFAGTGGSLTPLGVDPTTLHTNPAGIGWNRYNVVQITPGFTLNQNEGVLAFDGTSTSESAVNVNLPSIGAILAGSTRSINWSTFNFGISATRLADFNQQLRFGGRSPGSIIEGFASDLDQGIGSPFGADLGAPFVIEDEATGFIFSDFFDFDANQPRPESIGRSGFYDRRGSMTEIAAGFGGNYREKLLWGLSLGIPFFTFDQVYDYEELDDTDQIPVFENSRYTEVLAASGTGVNFKLGVIYLPTEQSRISASIHSPTAWSIDETFSSTFSYFFTEDGVAQGDEEISPISSSSFNLRTPWRFSLGAGYLIGKRGFVSVDADYADYRGNQISFEDFSTLDEGTNADIDAILASSIGLRLGGELNLKPFQLRAGVGYRQLPFAEYLNDEDEAQLTYHAGLGYSVGKFFVDVAAQGGTYGSFLNAYETATFSDQTVLTDRTQVSVLLTVGFRGFNFGF